MDVGTDVCGVLSVVGTTSDVETASGVRSSTWRVCSLVGTNAGSFVSTSGAAASSSTDLALFKSAVVGEDDGASDAFADDEAVDKVVAPVGAASAPEGCGSCSVPSATA